MSSESITFSGREFHAERSTMEFWLRLLVINLHYGGPKLEELQSKWLAESHDLECFIITLDGLEELFPDVLKGTDRLLSRLEDVGDSIDGTFFNLLGITDAFAPRGTSLEMKHVLKVGRAFRNLLVGDHSTSTPIERGEQDAAPNP